MKFTLCLVRCKVPVAMDLLSTSADHEDHQVGHSVSARRAHTGGSTLCTPIAKCMRGREGGEVAEDMKEDGRREQGEDIGRGRGWGNPLT